MTGRRPAEQGPSADKFWPPLPMPPLVGGRVSFPHVAISTRSYIEDYSVRHERKGGLLVGGSLKRCCADDEGVVALRHRPSGGDVKSPQAALANDCCGER